MAADAPASLLVALACRAHLAYRGDLGGRHVPPRLVRGHALVAIGLDGDDVRALDALGLRERRAQLSDRPHAFGHRTEARGVRNEIDREHVALRSLAVEPERAGRPIPVVRPESLRSER